MLKREAPPEPSPAAAVLAALAEDSDPLVSRWACALLRGEAARADAEADGTNSDKEE